MIITLDMSSGSYDKESFGDYADEVLDAQWTPDTYPPQPECQTGLQEIEFTKDVDADAFLHNVYLNQE